MKPTIESVAKLLDTIMTHYEATGKLSMKEWDDIDKPHRVEFRMLQMVYCLLTDEEFFDRQCKRYYNLSAEDTVEYLLSRCPKDWNATKRVLAINHLLGNIKEDEIVCENTLEHHIAGEGWYVEE